MVLNIILMSWFIQYCVSIMLESAPVFRGAAYLICRILQLTVTHLGSASATADDAGAEVKAILRYAVPEQIFKHQLCVS